MVVALLRLQREKARFSFADEFEEVDVGEVERHTLW